MEFPGYPHKPVMVDEVSKKLITVTEGVYVDATVGSGGHSEAILKSLSENGRLICIDRDRDAIEISRRRLGSQGERVVYKKESFSNIDTVLEDMGLRKVNGIFLDLGMSSYHLDHSGRGFSFNRDEPLDMRMDMDTDTTAEKLINSLSSREIKDILKKYGEEKKAGLISKSIERERRTHTIKSSLELADLVRSAIRQPRQPGVKDPATRTFQALRIAVNKELEHLKNFLNRVPDLIEVGGRLVFLTYHSLEDRLVKQTIAEWEKGCTCPPDFPKCVCGKEPLFRRVNKKGIKPCEKEIQENPRSRSAMLRAAERI